MTIRTGEVNYENLKTVFLPLYIPDRGKLGDRQTNAGLVDGVNNGVNIFISDSGFFGQAGVGGGSDINAFVF